MLILDDPLRFFGADALRDPYPTFRQMLDDGPVHRIGESDFHAVCGWGAVIDVLDRADVFSSNLTATMVFRDDGTITPFDVLPLDDPAHALATADEPAHAVHRKLLVPHLSAKRIRAIEEFAEAVTERLWRENLDGGRIEWMGALANRLPMMVVARLLGLPDADVDRLIRWAYATTTMLDGVVSDAQLQTASLAAFELAVYVQRHFDERHDGRGTLMDDLGARCASGEVSPTTAMTMMLTLFGAGGESTSSLLGSALLLLATRPDVQRRLRENPESIGVFIEETLRFEAPFRGHYRHVRSATTLGGVHLPAGSHVLLLWGAANRDPSQFVDPDRFRLDRTAGKGHLSFGRGAHYCVGAALARLEARVVLRHLLRHTTWIDAAAVGDWLPSILVRRLQTLHLTVTGPPAVVR